jgi:hypothetical protein
MHNSSKPRCQSLLIGFVLLLLCFSASNAADNYQIRETNRAYQQGDWITYGATRFVRYVSIGDPYVYFATTGGITRMNYFSYKWDFPWTTSNGLADNDVYLVAQDRNTGFLWAVTQKGVSYLEPASENWHNTFYNELGIYNHFVTSLGVSDDRQVYIVTSENRWYVSDNISASFQETPAPVTDDHIRWYGAKEQRSQSLPNFFMDDGLLFDGRQRYIDDLQFRHWQITTWVRDDWNNLWLGTWGFGAGRGDMVTQRLDMLDFGIWDETVDAIAEDQGGYWIGGMQDHNEHAGITQWAGQIDEPLFYEPYLIPGFASDQVTSITADARTVWFGTRGGLVRFDKRENLWKTYTIMDGLRNDHVYKVTLDDSHVWAATESGVSKILLASVGTDSMKIESVAFPSHKIIKVYDLAQQNNLLWMATEFGLYAHNKLTGKGGFYNGLEESFVGRSSFAISAWADEIWFGTDSGISGFNAATNEWLEAPAKFYAFDAGINRILTSHQAIWVATNEGVLKYDREMQRWVRFTYEDGLADDRVYSLQLEDDYIYFGTARGLTKFYWNSPFRND